MSAFLLFGTRSDWFLEQLDKMYKFQINNINEQKKMPKFCNHQSKNQDQASLMFHQKMTYGENFAPIYWYHSMSQESWMQHSKTRDDDQKMLTVKLWKILSFPGKLNAACQNQGWCSENTYSTIVKDPFFPPGTAHAMTLGSSSTRNAYSLKNWPYHQYHVHKGALVRYIGCWPLSCSGENPIEALCFKLLSM